MLPARFDTSSPEETEAVGAKVATELGPGDVVLLVGGLGAGKTTFVKGLAAALEVSEDVTSPTFSLCQIYSGRLKVLHADLWRLERLNEVVDLALDEGLDEGGVLLIEWGEGAESLFGDDALVVSFAEGSSSQERTLHLVGRGPSWEERVAEAP